MSSGDSERSLKLATIMAYLVGVLSVLFGAMELMLYMRARQVFVAHPERIRSILLLYGAGFLISGLGLVVFGFLMSKGAGISVMGALGFAGINALVELAAVVEGGMKKDFGQAGIFAICVLVTGLLIFLLTKSFGAVGEDSVAVPGSTRMTGYAAPPKKPVPAIKPRTSQKPPTGR